MLLFLFYCKTFEQSSYKCSKIEGIVGPEDFVFLEKENIFLISSHNRRNFKTLGEIFSFNIKTRELKIVNRIDEPKDLSFRPHGIDFYNNQLYVILHGKEQNSKWHAVAIYKWNGQELIFLRLIENDLFLSPNDISVYSDNVFFITNDSKNRGSLWELFLTISFGINKGSIVVCDISQNDCKFAANQLGFPNGIAIYKDQLFVSTTLENKVFSLSIDKNFLLTNKKEIAKIEGGDNIIIVGNKLYITSHPSLWKFLRHASNTENRAPSIGYEIDLENFKLNKLFFDNGTTISASSVVINLNNTLYLGQVFDPFVLQCSIP